MSYESLKGSEYNSIFDPFSTQDLIILSKEYNGVYIPIEDLVILGNSSQQQQNDVRRQQHNRRRQNNS